MFFVRHFIKCPILSSWLNYWDPCRSHWHVLLPQKAAVCVCYCSCLGGDTFLGVMESLQLHHPQRFCTPDVLDHCTRLALWIVYRWITFATMPFSRPISLFCGKKCRLLNYQQIHEWQTESEDSSLGWGYSGSLAPTCTCLYRVIHTLKLEQM